MEKYFNVDEVIDEYGTDRNLLVVGKTGSGKTTFLRNYLVKFEDKVIHFVDKEEMDILNNLLSILKERMEERLELFKEKKVTNLEGFNKISPIKFKKEFLVIENIDRYFDFLNKNKDFYTLLRQSRCTGIHFLGSTQREMNLVRLNNKLRNNFIVVSNKS
ncbi:AAA family ATPase [Virgibacillus sp. DJP39]|uniref:AAA family ATPase n=1 Tax=Virgibacillus sp. DJP39 TaxID=3409790 RepID=UPI003BB7D9DC